MRSLKTGVLIASLCSTIAGCTTADPVAYAGLASATQLKPNTEDKSGRTPYRYNVPTDWKQYNKIIVEPVVLYRGADNQFVKMSETDKAALASYMQSQFTEILKQQFAIVSMPAPGTLRLRLTLAGGRTTTPVLGPFSHLDVAGGVYNTVQAVRGKEGTMTGSTSYAVEVYDAVSDHLLLAYVSKQYPNAVNIGASFGLMAAARVGVRKGAEDLLAQIR
ncbi:MULTISPECIES: DUF3313 domain-containing protein [unclassified Sinorhizobium]|uniref:DUF3313 domain-containing protein n=1 Tax=unclassified Sinorhizobium TaxID=2613772 RepID=UPI0035247F8B